jgi:hypothetical protein
MYFNEWKSDGGKGVADRNTGVCERSGVHYKKECSVELGALDPVDQSALMIALEKDHFCGAIARNFRQLRLDVGESFGAVDCGLPRSEEVQVGSVQDQNPSWHRVSRKMMVS